MNESIPPQLHDQHPLTILHKFGIHFYLEKTINYLQLPRQLQIHSYKIIRVNFSFSESKNSIQFLRYNDRIDRCKWIL